MKPETVAKFKADPMNQLHQKKPVTFFIVIFGCAMLGASVTSDLLHFFLNRTESWMWQRYTIALGTAIGTFLGTRHRWNSIRNEEANNEIQPTK